MGSLITETPFSEIVATLETLDQLGVTRDDLRNLRKPGHVRRGFMQSLRDPLVVESFAINVGDGLTARELLDACHFDRIGSISFEERDKPGAKSLLEKWIDAPLPADGRELSGKEGDREIYYTFPMAKEPREVVIELLDFRDYRPTEEQVLMEMKQRGLVPPKVEDALRFAHAYPEVQKRDWRKGHSPWHSRSSQQGIIFYSNEKYVYERKLELWLSSWPKWHAGQGFDGQDRRIELDNWGPGGVPPGWVFAARQL